MNRTEFIGTNLYYSQEFIDDMKKDYIQELERLNNIIKELKLKNSNYKFILYGANYGKINDKISEKKIPEKILHNEFDELTKEAKLWNLFYKYNDLLDYLKSKEE